MKILVCGGDARQLYAAKALREDGFDIFYALTEGESDDIPSFAEKIRAADAALLPLPVFRAGFLNAPASSLRLDIGAAAALLRDARVVIGGILPPALTQSPEVRAVAFCDYYRDADFTLKNAELTAEGVLGLLIAHTPRAVRGASYLITGYGASGKAIARLLKTVGASVTVAARKKEARESARADGCAAIPFASPVSAAPQVGAVINTVPARVIGADALGALPSDALLLEISSAPFGIDFEAAAEKNLRVIKAPGIPGRVAADSAGRIIAACAEKYLNKKENPYE